MPRRYLCSFALVATLLVSSEARAGKYDLDLTPLGTVGADGTVTGQDFAAFRSLASEIGVVMAPKPVDPADSLGLSGFAVSADISVNTLSYKKDYWTRTANGPDGVAPTLQVMGRKGLWPGLEVGAGVTKMFDSRMWTIQGYGKFALHEGFHHLPIPSIAVRGMFSHLLGSTHLKMTTISADVSISHVFGIGKTFSLTPYVGYQALMVLASSTLIDTAPNDDEVGECIQNGGGADCSGTEFGFSRQDVILRHRPFLGLRFIFSVLRLGVEAMVVPGGKSKSDESFNGMTQTIADGSGLQQQYTVSLGLDF